MTGAVTVQLYTSSRLRVLRECLRKHFYRYVLNIRGAESQQMRFGTVTHLALEGWYRAWQRGDVAGRLDAALALLDATGVSPEDRERIRALIVAYDQRWGGQPWIVLGVEVEFRYELGEYLIGGKIDALIRDTRDGRVWIVEHKTAGGDASPGSAYWERLAIDTQVSVYVDGATMLGHEIAGCIYDVLQRPKHERKLATPVADREYTVGKGCKLCGGSLQGKQGSGRTGEVSCVSCVGTGWRHADGKPESPRLYKNQRDADESIDDFAARVSDEIAGDVDAFLIRGAVVRLDDELPKMRTDLVDAIKVERMTSMMFGDAPPRNPDACAKFGSLCSFFGACSGRESIYDETKFPRERAHPELAAA